MCGSEIPPLSRSRIGIAVTCGVCFNTKKPVGRSAPLEWRGCDEDCDGYRGEPRPGSLWPGESEADFGYPVSADATTDTPQEPAPAVPAVATPVASATPVVAPNLLSSSPPSADVQQVIAEMQEEIDKPLSAVLPNMAGAGVLDKERSIKAVLTYYVARLTALQGVPADRIVCLCGDMFPSVAEMWSHLDMVHADECVPVQGVPAVDLRRWVQHLPDCPALPANHDRFTRDSKPFRDCLPACGLDAALQGVPSALQETTKEEEDTRVDGQTS